MIINIIFPFLKVSNFPGLTKEICSMEVIIASFINYSEGCQLQHDMNMIMITR